MRKSPIWLGEPGISGRFQWRTLPLMLVFGGLLPWQSLGMQETHSGAPRRTEQEILNPTPPEQGVGALIQSQIVRLKAEVERVRVLVENGILARNKLQQVEERLADAEDQGVLAATLYSAEPVDKLSEPQASSMMAAAARRVARQEEQIAERRRLLDSGAISQTEFDAVAAELEDRKRVLELAGNRAKLLADLRRMAENERLAERAIGTAPATLKNSMMRYQGNGLFSLADVPTINAQFERRFHHALPVSALGQTLLHQSLGLDHRNRVDVALNPASQEGLWLCSLLEKLHVPYLAFSSAVAGAATAPHIHIGMESTRLKPAIGS